MRISVVLCTYNGAAHLEHLLESIANQSLLPDEMIISDDASTDETPAILERFKKKQAFAIQIFNSVNTLGVNKNYEFALNQCSGDLVFIADQDDIWLEDKIRVMSQLATQTKNAVIFSDAEMINDKGEIMHRRIWDYFKYRHDSSQSQQDLLERVLLSNIVTGSTVAIRKDILNDAMPFPDSDDYLYDEWLTLVILAQRKTGILPVEPPLMQYRFHEGQFTARSRVPVESKFPFNRQINYAFIKRKQRLLKMLATHLAKQDISSVHLDDVRQFWDDRLYNYEAYSFRTKLRLATKFISGRYHSFAYWPVRSWIKDMIAWPIAKKDR